MKRFYFIFYLLYWYSYIVYFVCTPASEFGARPKGGEIASSSFFEKKKIILGRNRTQGFNLLAKVLRASRGDSFTRQVSLWDRNHGLHVRAK